jgi:hypothetical protein
MCLGGISLLLGFSPGLFLSALAALVGFIGGAIGAWSCSFAPEVSGDVRHGYELKLA